jgi:hypothetical protein
MKVLDPPLPVMELEFCEVGNCPLSKTKDVGGLSDETMPQE